MSFSHMKVVSLFPIKAWLLEQKRRMKKSKKHGKQGERKADRVCFSWIIERSHCICYNWKMVMSSVSLCRNTGEMRRDNEQRSEPEHFLSQQNVVVFPASEFG